MAPDRSGIVLVTGANGFVGFGIVSKALQDGYQVRGVVRRKEGMDIIKDTPTGKKYLANGALSLVLIPDLSMSGALLEAAAGCTSIVHAGSPIPSGNPENLILETLDGIRRILEVAEATTTIRRVVFTLSVYSLFQDDDLVRSMNPPKVDPSTRVSAEDLSEPLYSSSSSVFRRYNIAKLASKKLIDDYHDSQAQQNSHFSIVNIYPAFVLGPSEIIKTKSRAYSQSCGFLAYMWIDLSPFMYTYLEQPPGTQLQFLACHCHAMDCSEAHVRALDIDKVKGKLRNFLVCSDGPLGHPWELATSVVRRDLPGVAESINWMSPTIVSKFIRFDCKDTEDELLGRKLASFSKQVCDTIPWMLSLPDK